MGRHSARPAASTEAATGRTRAADDDTVRRPSAIPGLADVRLIAQPTYRFDYRGQSYALSFDRAAAVWVCSWVRDTDGELVPMAIRQDRDDAVRDALDDVDALHGRLPR